MTSQPTPKQPQLEKHRDWYPYYAGFSADFVDRTLTEHFSAASSIIDPWNGSGTTTTVGAAQGKRCLGIDINPAVTTIARARLTPESIAESLIPIAKEIMIAAQREEALKREFDPLHLWLRRPAVETLRRLQRGIHRVVMSDKEDELEVARDPDGTTSSLPILASFFYTALFAAARDILRPYRSSNPTWLRDPKSFRHRLSPSAELVHTLFKGRVSYLANRLSLPSEARAAQTSVRTGSVVNLKGDGVYDGCLTSPPYATRLDYVRTTLAELSVLGLDSGQIDRLRRETTGTPVVRGVVDEDIEFLSSHANRLAEGVKRHASHGSSNYYAPWIKYYLSSLEESLMVIDRVVIRGGPIGLVVQDSHYKDLHVDLQAIVVEAFEAVGRQVRTRSDYVVRHSIARMNPAARRYLAERKVVESLLIFS